MSTQVAQSNTSRRNATTVDKRSNISRRELIAEYIEPGIPVVLTDGASKWSAMGKFTPEYFKSKYGHLTKEIRGHTYTLAETVDRLLTSTPDNPAPYPFCLNIEKLLPELMADITPEVSVGAPDRVRHPLLSKMMLLHTEVYELFLGGNGACFPFLHVDALYLHTQITQVYGSKDFVLYPPEQTAYLYPEEDNPKISRVNIFNPDYEKHPLFKNAKPVRVTVEQGETILFPTKWWHTTQINEPCISVARSYLNTYNWPDFVDDNFQLRKDRYPALALAMLGYSKVLGRLMDWQEKSVLAKG